MPPRSRKGWKSKADKLMSQYIKQRDNMTCVKCGKKHAQMHPHHLVSRTVSVLRHDPMNLVLLCPGCHFFAHQHSIEFTHWLDEVYAGSRSVYLIDKKNQEHKKVDYSDVCDKLQKLIGE